MDWSALPPARVTGPRAGHPFEGDLDLVGERSLHRLMDTTVSEGGSVRLRDWLGATTPDLADIRRRQALVAELVPPLPLSTAPLDQRRRRRRSVRETDEAVAAR